MLSTTNPPGVGSSWVRDRFVRVRNPDGKTVPWGSTIYEEGENPFTGEKEPRLPRLLAEDLPGGHLAQRRTVLVSMPRAAAHEPGVLRPGMAVEDEVVVGGVFVLADP